MLISISIRYIILQVVNIAFYRVSLCYFLFNPADLLMAPLDQNPPFYEKDQHLDRVLSRPQLVGIGISGCVGVGIFVTSGTLVSTTGSVGAAVSYVVAGGKKPGAYIRTKVFAKVPFGS